jgi:two-component system response regulator RegA
MNDITLIIDDDHVFNTVLARTLERRGYSTLGAIDIPTALDLARQHQPERIILDLNLNGSSGLGLIPDLLAINPDCQIVVLTGYASIATAVEAVKRGAIQYLAKPVEIEAILTAFEGNEHLDADPGFSEETLTIDRMEWEHIQRVLVENEGNVSATARALKMHRRTLQRKLSKRPAKN